MIRTSTESDLDRLVEMGCRFHRESPYRDKLAVNPEKMRSTAKFISDAGTLLISESEGKILGMLGFVLFSHFLSGEMTAGEVFWWVEPEHRGEGIKLLRCAEKMARVSGAKTMQMIAPSERVENLYKRLNYGYVESTYQKTL
jgi:hypothetical protein